MTIRSRRRTLAVLTAIAALTATLVGASNSQADSRGTWVGTWATAITKAGGGSSGVGFDDESIRMIVHTSVGGDGVRIRLSDSFGDRALIVGHATVGLPAASGAPDVEPSTIHELTFAGDKSVTVYRGGDVISDPVSMSVPAVSDLVVTIYLPQATGPSSWHFIARETSYVYDGDHTTDPSGVGYTVARTSFYFLAGVDVLSDSARGSVVVLGDSISDGYHTTLDANHRWPDYLAGRIVDTSPAINDPGVLNEAISGGRLTHDGIEIGYNELGVSGLARLDADVFGQTNVRTAIVELGVNDIWMTNDPAERIIGGLKQLAAQLRENHVRVLVSTIMPFEGYSGWSPEKETTRSAVNDYIRSTHDFDGVIDFDKALRDPAAPTKLRADLDSGDHIHPNDVGNELMADAVPLWLL